MSHEPITPGFDALNPPPREGESMVKWPILAQLPWVGEPLPGGQAAPRSAAIPFESTADPYALPPAGGPAKSPPLRLVEPQYDYAEEDYAAVEPVDRRLHAAPVEGRSATEPPHLSVHRFTPAEPLRAVAEEPEYRAPRPAANAAPRQWRVDPPQARTSPAVSLHRPTESLAAQLYQWHTSARPQMALIAFAGLILLGGSLYWAASGAGRSQPEAKPLDATPWTIDQPAQPTLGGAAAAPASKALPSPPPLDLTPKPTAGNPRAGAAASREPATTAELSTNDDPIAAWLNSQPLVTPHIEAPKVAAEPAVTEPAAVAPVVVAKPVANDPPLQLVSPAPAPSPAPATTPVVRDETITPTPAAMPTATPPQAPTMQGMSLSLGYPTTPYPPFNFSLAPPPTSSGAPSVAETLGLPIQQLSTPR